MEATKYYTATDITPLMERSAEQARRLIRASQHSNGITHIDGAGIEAAGGSLEFICLELFMECEGNAQSGALHEFWGSDESGEWRVHVKAG